MSFGADSKLLSTVLVTLFMLPLLLMQVEIKSKGRAQLKELVTTSVRELVRTSKAGSNEGKGKRMTPLVRVEYSVLEVAVCARDTRRS